MSVLMPSGRFTVQRRAMVEDKHGVSMPGGVEDVVTVDGRARRNATGIDLTLDPAAWPDVDVEHQGHEVLIFGPDIDGQVRSWIVRSAALRKGLDSDLDDLSHIVTFCEPTDI